MSDAWWGEADRQAAIDYCKSEIAFYRGVFAYNNDRWKFWQYIAITAGVVGTVLASISSKDEWLPYVRPIPVAIASIAAGILGSFSFQAESVRQGVTSDLLVGELAKFLSGAEPYGAPDERANVSAFVGAVRLIVQNEQSGWQAQVSSSAKAR